MDTGISWWWRKIWSGHKEAQICCKSSYHPFVFVFSRPAIFYAACTTFNGFKCLRQLSFGVIFQAWSSWTFQPSLLQAVNDHILWVFHEDIFSLLLLLIFEFIARIGFVFLFSFVLAPISELWSLSFLFSTVPIFLSFSAPRLRFSSVIASAWDFPTFFRETSQTSFASSWFPW